MAELTLGQKALLEEYTHLFAEVSELAARIHEARMAQVAGGGDTDEMNALQIDYLGKLGRCAQIVRTLRAAGVEIPPFGSEGVGD